MRQDDVGGDVKMITNEIKQIIKERFKKGNVVTLTGAGISAESGIPTFRGKGGLWEKYNPQTYATPDGLLSVLRARPHDLAHFIVDFYSLLLAASPNPAHLGLSLLERKGILKGVITQNIDNLHQEAGSRRVIELHGNSYRLCCMGCRHTITLEKQRLKEFTSLLHQARNSYYKIMETLSRYFPRCRCGNRYRIDIVFFGEALSLDELKKAHQELETCETLLLIGSSFEVYPAASLPLYAKERGAMLIEINEEPSALSDACDVRIKGKASEVIPSLVKLIEE